MIEEPEVWGVESMTPDGVTVRVTLKTAPMEQWRVAREMRARIKARFDHEGIEMPQRLPRSAERRRLGGRPRAARHREPRGQSASEASSVIVVAGEGLADRAAGLGSLGRRRRSPRR